MIVLHAMPVVPWGLLNPSPFCAKVAAAMRLMGVRFTLRPTLSTRGAPKGKLPWIDDGGVHIADSEAILAHLRQTRGDRLGDATIPPNRAQDLHLVRRTLEESFYFILVAERWISPDIRKAYLDDLLADMPRVARPVAARVATRLVLRQLWQQGTGRHALADIIERGRQDLDAVAHALGDRAYFAGELPRSIDATVFGFLTNIAHVPIGTRLQAHLRTQPNLVAFLDRMAGRLGE